MALNIFTFFVSITYGVTVCNEHAELDKLLECLVDNINFNDEIIVLQDVTKKDAATTAVIQKYGGKIKHVEAKLDNDFASFKNLLIKHAKSKYLFQIDADELPKVYLLKNLKRKLFKKRDFDCFLIPRINIVNGYTNEHREKWNWNVNPEGYINFPDYQPRVVRLNGKIRWKNKVHEVFTGYKNQYFIADKNYRMCLLHIKDIDRQQRQNDFYDTLV
ncbi:glycosyltransferase [Mucilaginibacter litoreus]|uniref:Glycosyltransferase n=1 Tax=Mucilaginibacter litoreus TaxID=1048221 RepID=A0ABW3AZK5_9SPHI